MLVIKEEKDREESRATEGAHGNSRVLDLRSFWSAPRELESYFPRISTGRSAGFMFTRASSNSFGET